MRNRIPPPVLTAVSIALIWAADSYGFGKTLDSQYIKITAVVVGVIGIGLLLWAGILFKRQETTVNPFRPDKTQSIVAHGPYRFSRNPMYLGMLLLIVSAGLYFANLMALLILFCFWFYMNETQIKPEERALVEKFGAEFNQYSAKVRRWI